MSIFDLVREGEIEGIRRCLREGLDVNTTDEVFVLLSMLTDHSLVIPAFMLRP